MKNESATRHARSERRLMGEALTLFNSTSAKGSSVALGHHPGPLGRY